jgi:hypothetical protein
LEALAETTLNEKPVIIRKSLSIDDLVKERKKDKEV